MILFVKLLLAHLIGDFLLQPNSWISDKEDKKLGSKFLYIHMLVHGIVTWLLIGTTDFAPWVLLLVIVHGAIDAIKLYFQKKKTKRIWFFADQAAHILTIAGIGLLYTNQTLTYTGFDDRFWIIITGLLFLTMPTSIIIKNSISVWTPEPKDKSDDSLQNAGNYIGILERLFVFCFILTGHFEAIGFLLAAKSIFRFGDLKEAKERKLTEYVLIGTLLSFGIALLTGILVQAFL